jgi:hypothetical protein
MKLLASGLVSFRELAALSQPELESLKLVNEARLKVRARMRPQGVKVGKV